MEPIKKAPNKRCQQYIAGSFYTHFIHTLNLIKFSHSIFALPFALASMLVAAHGWPGTRIFLLILGAMVSARSAAMAFNRLVDADIDAKNPRTQTRHIPKGLLSKQYVGIFTLLCALGFFGVCYAINPLAFRLSPIALAILLGYSFAKRFTWLTHFWLGISLGIAPIAAWIAVTGQINMTSVWLGLGVLFWVAGFDIFYSTQDAEFDSQEGIHSAVSLWGIVRGLRMAKQCHVLTMLFLILFGLSAPLSTIYWITLVLISIAFVWEHSLVKPQDLSHINTAFFTINGFISLGFFAGVAVSIWH
ncbi:MAG: UbiA family prenyltransferase [Deltaproteobacteria bacterium]|nr:UbiA family prenyltransferase [Deltaproteobacteria bacterium]